MTLSDVWLAEEYHGYHYIFSTRDIAETWLQKELYNSFGDIDLGRPEFDEHEDANNHGIYYEGELVGRYEKFVLDKID